MASVSSALTAAMCSATTPASSVAIMMRLFLFGGGLPAFRDEDSRLPHGEDQDTGADYFLPPEEVSDWGHGFLAADRRLLPSDSHEHQDAAALPSGGKIGRASCRERG